MSESDDSKQRSEVDETQRQQDEDKLRTEGGARLNGRLAATAVGVVMGLVVLLTLAVQSSGPRQSAQSGEASHDGDNTTADKTAVQDLIANATEPTPAPVYQAPATAPSSMVIPSRQTEASAPPRQPSRYAEWEREKYMKALEAPQMVAAFHDSTLEIPSRLRSDGRVDNAGENPEFAAASGGSGGETSPAGIAVHRDGRRCDPRGPGQRYQLRSAGTDTRPGQSKRLRHREWALAADPAGEQADRLVSQLSQLRAEPGARSRGTGSFSRTPQAWTFLRCRGPTRRATRASGMK